MPARSPRRRAGRTPRRSSPRPATRWSRRCSGIRLDVSVDPDVPVRLDPRLTATALAHLLENAAQYSPAGSTIERERERRTAMGWSSRCAIAVQASRMADLPHLFDRFYRGAAATTHLSGTGMGLSIARGLLAVERGQIWAENGPDGGAQFTIVVPAATREPEPSSLGHAHDTGRPHSARRRRGVHPAGGGAAAAVARLSGGCRRHRDARRSSCLPSGRRI